jgi:hypothetical protein
MERIFRRAGLREALRRADLAALRGDFVFVLRAALRVRAVALRFAITGVLSASSSPEASLTVYP